MIYQIITFFEGLWLGLGFSGIFTLRMRDGTLTGTDEETLLQVFLSYGICTVIGPFCLLISYIQNKK